MKKVTLLSFLFLLSVLSFCQEKWEGAVFLGYSNYLGDMVEPVMTLDEASPAFGIMLRNHVTSSFGLRMNLLYGRIKGNDANYESLAERGAKFESPLVELSLMGEYEFRGKKRYSADGRFTKTWTPYIFAGVGVSFLNPDIPYGSLRPSPGIEKDAVANYSNAHFALPIGGGIKFDVNRKINIGIEWGGRLHFSDYLDGIKLGGDPDDSDVSIFGGVVVGFRFGDIDSDKDGVKDDVDKCPTLPGSPALGGCPDRDGDGMADRDDGCPDEAGEQRLNGCPDTDGDGIADKVDDCPTVSGLRRFSGCPDTDNDGIIDKEDNCPTVPGIPAMNGCPDADRDGITDADDQCPNEPGTAESKGCPDTDNDGISDKDDVCPDRAGPRRFNGCPDTDNDGIDDTKDKCPTLAGPAGNNGCPDITPADKGVLEQAMSDVKFETGNSVLLPSSLSTLKEIAEIMKRYPGYKLQIDGYTDNVGNDFVNQQLSQERAKACYDFLGSNGVEKALMRFTGHGENRPVAPNTTAKGRAKNRRVQFILSPK